VLLVGALDAAHGVDDCRAHIRGGLAHIAPVATFWDLETVLIGEGLAVGGDHLGAFLVPNIADALEEQASNLSRDNLGGDGGKLPGHTTT